MGDDGNCCCRCGTDSAVAAVGSLVGVKKGKLLNGLLARVPWGEAMYRNGDRNGDPISEKLLKVGSAGKKLAMSSNRMPAPGLSSCSSMVRVRGARGGVDHCCAATKAAAAVVVVVVVVVVVTKAAAAACVQLTV